MKRKFLLIVMCGLLSACVPSTPPPASKAEQDAAGMALMACLHNAARTEDDNKSPADSVALAILSTCASQNEQYKETFKRGMSFVAQEMFDQKSQSNNDDMKLATSVVLDERQKRPQQSQEQTDGRPSSVSSLEGGLTAENNGDYATALKLLRPLADHGNPFAQTAIGYMYGDGEGVPKDDAEAAQWFRKAADQGLPDAQFALGVSYEIGRGVIQDYVQAYKWLNLAAVIFPKSQPEKRANAIKIRDQLTLLMTPAQIADGQQLAREWKPK